MAKKIEKKTISSKKILNTEHKKMLDWLQKVRFRKKIFGGVDEQDVWKKLEELNRMYEAALNAERTRYDVLLRRQFCEPVQNQTNTELSQNQEVKQHG